MGARPLLPTTKNTRRALAGLAGLAAVKAVALVLLMAALAHALAQWAAGTPADPARLLVQGTLGAVLMAAAIWGQQVLARRAALGTKEELRAKLVAHRLSGHAPASDGTRNAVGAQAMLASRGLDGLDNYFTAYLPALVTCAVLPAMIGLQILISDWVSALIVVLTVPLVPVFMILIGFHTQERVEQAAHGLDRLSNHLLELARGLPVLVGLRRADAQRKALAEVSEQYRKSTMTTLRTAFLSSMALELISTISVAVVAVFIGVRLVYGGMGLEAGLLALMLAPECFRPLRDLGAAHHGSEDGVEALRRVNEILDAGTPAAPDVEDVHDDGVFAVHASKLTVAYPGRSEAAVSNFNATVERGGVLVLDGPSGTGKSTVLAVLAGLLPLTEYTGTTASGAAAAAHDSEAETCGPLISGQIATAPRSSTVWVPQHPVFTEDTVAADVALYAAGPAGLRVPAAVVQDALSRVNAGHVAQRSPLDCSPGELRRVAVARALARIALDPSVELALFDEPTAHLDEVSAQAVRDALCALRGKVAMVVASHDRELAALLRGETVPAVKPAAEQGALASAERPVDQQAVPQEVEAPAPRFQWRWLKALPLLSPRFAAGVLVSALATLSAAALAGISGWLIVWAADRPPMLFLLTLIVGVRAFGIGRSVLRYSERLLTHDAVFRWAATLRLRLWDALGSNVRHWGRLTRSGGSLGTLVADVDELRDALPRTVVPIPAAVISYAAVLLTVVLMVPEVAWMVVVLGVVALLILPVVVFVAQRRASAAAGIHRSWLASRTTTLFAAADQLAANGVGPVEAARFTARDLGVAAPLRRLAWVNGLGQSAVSLVTSLAAIVVTIGAVAAGADPRAVAVVALLMLALAEPLGQYIDAVAELPLLLGMMGRTMPLLDSSRTVVDRTPSESADAGETVTALEVTDITARYPDAATPVFTGVSGGTDRGHWWSVSGPSGSGKSTLLAVLLGFLTPEKGHYTLNERPATDTALGHIAWCPQESYLFNSTLRSNLSLARSASDAPLDAELETALQTVGLGPWYGTLPQGLDTRVGAGGHELSGGQRTRVSVARTLVAGSDVVLLDEPTAHLGEDEARELIADLRHALADAAVVLVTHDDDLAAGADTHLDLGEGYVVREPARV
ncbi:thiol reductant ABC exporter subunit CydD [Arthrobacter sp. GMC3]|uniref:thiol reductant ABC exporter subunit CydD n=1 Tax=Arthrobacter sp. GMC3 TaxID=2058894 RepID=UPI000CE4E6D8|nr:thiol reductant ABC exporter subunit CydD [Arthrobacter sp. GMC3]